ncbi:hypothetical protein EVAR_27879_1 [Eumeta japonica]|uniref:Uncharacterized protein n=1 Tax=Eumeta variegata TaxID=151549 RepID=A0A4C1UW68_EUMVA|nr:hypothetical protein EVAR_27879_1 [Eumeta japonica]
MVDTRAERAAPAARPGDGNNGNGPHLYGAPITRARRPRPPPHIDVPRTGRRRVTGVIALPFCVVRALSPRAELRPAPEGLAATIRRTVGCSIKLQSRKTP